MPNHLTKLTLYLLLFLICFNTPAQEKKDVIDKSKLTMCDRGKLDAKKSFDNGNYTFTSYGLNLSQLKKKYQYHAIYDSILLYDYKIKVVRGGCTINEFTKCYEQELRRLVENKYGKNYIADAKSKAVKIYSNTKEYKTKVLPLLKQDSIFKSVDPTEYHKRINRRKTITKLLNSSNLSSDIKDSKISFRYKLFKNGKIEIVKFSSPKDIEHQQKIRNALKNISPLTPAYFFTEPVNTYNYY